MKSSEITIKEMDCIKHNPDSETLKRLAHTRTKMGSNAAIATDSTFRMPACVGSQILSTWKAQRVLARAKKVK